MPAYVESMQEFSFRLEQNRTVDEIIAAFSRYFWRENKYDRKHYVSRSYMDGQIRMVLVDTVWGWAGYVSAIILLYLEDDNRCRAQIVGFSRGSKLGRLDTRLLRQIMGFFGNEGRSLVGDLDQLPKPPAQYAGDSYPISDNGGAALESEPEVDERPTSSATCYNCGAASHIVGAGYCWNCGTKLAFRLRHAHAQQVEADVKIVTQGAKGLLKGGCMICRINLESGELLAWCPHCGSVAHRIHMLNWLQVKNRCPACGSGLTIEELSGQLSRAHLAQGNASH